MIEDSFFGVIETGYGEVDEFELGVDALGGTGIRWPGGTLSEVRTDVYDLNYPDLFDADALYSGSSVLVRAGISDVLARAVSTGEALTINIPTARYADDPATGVADISAFLDRLFTGEYATLPNNLIPL